MPLDRTIQELEAQLPDLRHLLADGEIILTTNDTAALLADELGFLLARAGTVAHRLRHLLLGGSLPNVTTESATLTTPATPVASVTDAPPPADAPPLDVAPETGSDAWTDMDEELMRVLGLSVEDTPGEPDEEQGRLKAQELRARYGITDPPREVENETAAERQLRELEEKLRLSGDPAADQQYIEHLEALAHEVIEDQDKIRALFQEMGLTPPQPRHIEQVMREMKPASELSNPARQMSREQLEAVPPEVQEHLKILGRAFGRNPIDDADDLPGGASVGARLDPPPPPQSSGAERTFAEAGEAPRSL